MYVASDLFHYKGKTFFLSRTLTLHGIPDKLRKDGGPQYASHQSQKFREEWNFQHRILSPHYPRSNCLVERYTEIDRVNKNRHKPAPLQATQDAEVVQAVPNSRSYIIDSPRGRYRRNLWFLKPLKGERPQSAQDKYPLQGATISPPRTSPGGIFPEISESLQFPSAEPGNHEAGDHGNNSRSTSPDFRWFSHDPEHPSTFRNTYEYQMANAPRKM
ncbi:hypothetical protein PR048_011547 [Dryococelus australis]|uniref:Integrase catalytic domain-containing protein n=1 Tax=Dryococelus australis TaxID=614101 RepID=A0ABQ9HM19_9NEOP|nr:hypothetical protein PR048_011547 [Dryococelus australis]